MAGRIEDYALIGDTETAALVCANGSIDFWPTPRFDSATAFCALLGTEDHGHWQVAPKGVDGKVGVDLDLGQGISVTRRYLPDTLVLETLFETPEGSVALIDFMPIRSHEPAIVRIVEGRSGTVEMYSHLTIRFDYGSVVPWVRSVNGGITAIGGGDALTLHTDVPVHGEDLSTVGEFTVHEGEQVSFNLTWHESHHRPPRDFSATVARDRTESWWRDWIRKCTYDGRWSEQVHRSLIVLKALTYAPTGGIVAAPTTSLPEQLGGERNWDYRYCWLRDASFTLTALLDSGFEAEALAWGAWLRRAVAGDPADLQIMYGVAGERRLTELELDWLPGYANSRPVRTGNDAHGQLQLDVFGEVLDLFHTLIARRGKLANDGESTGRVIMEHLASIWSEPDDGIWEVRSERQHFVHSKVMAWVAVDRWIRIIEMLELDEDLDRWRSLASEIHEDVCKNGWNDEVGSFTQAYGSTALDASLLLIPITGFLAPDDPRVVATVEAVQRDLDHEGFLLRYRTEHTDDGLEGDEGVFLLTTYWLVEALAVMGRHDEAVAIFERCLGLANDVGLLSEEYDPVGAHQLGNMPQAFSHLGLIISALSLAGDRAGPAFRRCGIVAERDERD